MGEAVESHVEGYWLLSGSGGSLPSPDIHEAVGRSSGLLFFSRSPPSWSKFVVS